MGWQFVRMKKSKAILILMVCTLVFTLSAQQIIPKPVTFGFRKTETRHIDVVVVHSTYNASGGDHWDLTKILSQFRRYGVAAHYIIDRSGTIYQLVDDTNIAYHAGKSKLPDGTSGINSRSLGIELINDTVEHPTEQQYVALTDLLVSLRTHYPIKHIVRHSDIAPGRKTDPWNTDWERVMRELSGRDIQPGRSVKDR